MSPIEELLNGRDESELDPKIRDNLERYRRLKDQGLLGPSKLNVVSEGSHYTGTDIFGEVIVKISPKTGIDISYIRKLPEENKEKSIIELSEEKRRCYQAIILDGSEPLYYIHNIFINPKLKVSELKDSELKDSKLRVSPFHWEPLIMAELKHNPTSNFTDQRLTPENINDIVENVMKKKAAPFLVQLPNPTKNVLIRYGILNKGD